MTESPIPAEELSIVRVCRPDHDLLVTLETYDFEAFGLTGLRTYDLAVMAQAGSVYVRPRWQGRGLGRAFLLALAEEIRRLGARGLLLTVAPSNERALSLYKSVGFVDETFVRDFYGDGQDRHILRWRFRREGLQGSV
jgi:ribosomal protein S18 acetylase RimI-like enzyme